MVANGSDMDGHGNKKPPDLCPRLIDYFVLVGSRHPGRVERPADSNQVGSFHETSDQPR